MWNLRAASAMWSIKIYMRDRYCTLFIRTVKSSRFIGKTTLSITALPTYSCLCKSYFIQVTLLCYWSHISPVPYNDNSPSIVFLIKNYSSIWVRWNFFRNFIMRQCNIKKTSLSGWRFRVAVWTRPICSNEKSITPYQLFKQVKYRRNFTRLPGGHGMFPVVATAMIL